MKAFLILSFFAIGLFFGCNSSYQLNSSINQGKCKEIDIYFDCLYGKFKKADFDNDRELKRVFEKAGKQCSAEQDIKQRSSPTLEAGVIVSSISRKCANEIADFIYREEYLKYLDYQEANKEMGTQFLYCIKQEVKKEVGCSL